MAKQVSVSVIHPRDLESFMQPSGVKPDYSRHPRVGELSARKVKFDDYVIINKTHFRELVLSPEQMKRIYPHATEGGTVESVLLSQLRTRRPLSSEARKVFAEVLEAKIGKKVLNPEKFAWVANNFYVTYAHHENGLVATDYAKGRQTMTLGPKMTAAYRALMAEKEG